MSWTDAPDRPGPRTPDAQDEDLVHGAVDPEGRCRHHHGPGDVVALRLPCCALWYACRTCHDEAADHPAAVWPEAAWDRAVMARCVVCDARFTATEYRAAVNACPACGHAWNPACRSHRHLYFEVRRTA